MVDLRNAPALSNEKEFCRPDFDVTKVKLKSLLIFDDAIYTIRRLLGLTISLSGDKY